MPLVALGVALLALFLWFVARFSKDGRLRKIALGLLIATGVILAVLAVMLIRYALQG